MIKTKASWVRLVGLGGLCLTLWACGGEDSKGNGENNSENVDDDDDDDFDDFDSDQQHSNQQETAESECSGPSECEPVVCDCADGPVNFQGCNVVNGAGTCATESTCASSFGACD